jgi:hypothetical protein
VAPHVVGALDLLPREVSDRLSAAEARNALIVTEGLDVNEGDRVRRPP